VRMSRSACAALVMACGLFAGRSDLSAQSRPLTIPRVDPGALHVDGSPTESAWDRIPDGDWHVGRADACHRRRGLANVGRIADGDRCPDRAPKSPLGA
jgi:hypothetical protein